MKNLSSLPPWLTRPDARAKVERELATRSLAEFVRQAWHVIEPATILVWGFHIEAICEHLEAVSRGEIRNLLINIPPRHMKSLLVSVFWPAWEWTRWPERRFLCSSYSASLSIRDSVKCRRLIESPWYRERWGHRFTLSGDQNLKSRFDNNRSGYRLSTSVGGAVTGEGGDRILCDLNIAAENVGCEFRRANITLRQEEAREHDRSRQIVGKCLVREETVLDNDESAPVFTRLEEL